MRIRKNIAVSDEGFIFNPATGDSFSTNKIGSDIINMLKQNKSIDELKETITQIYDVEISLFERDLDDFISLLKNYNITE
ncbi:hypothetical protein MASR2M117_22020 [Paludibacter sp.]